MNVVGKGLHGNMGILMNYAIVWFLLWEGFVAGLGDVAGAMLGRLLWDLMGVGGSWELTWGQGTYGGMEGGERYAQRSN